ncbi:hypothetical protein [Aquipseudomonas campi]
MSATEPRPLKVLTPENRQRLSAFNAVARMLQGMDMRLLKLDVMANTLTLQPHDGKRLLRQNMVLGFQRQPSAGSTYYSGQVDGVTVEWREPISHTRPEEYSRPHTTIQ